MITYRISASSETTGLLREIMRAIEAEESESAELTLVERGFPEPDDAFFLSFSASNLAPLIRFLNGLNPSRRGPQFLIGRKHETFEPLLLSDILFFRSAGNALFAHTERQAYEIKYKLFEMEKLIACQSFFRVNKSNIVNVLKIREIIPWFGGRILLRFAGSEERIEVSRNYVRDFKQFLNM